MNNAFSRLSGSALLTCAMLLAAAPASSARLPALRDGAEDGTVTVTIKGILLAAPPCIINNNQPIDVNFGDNLNISKIDGNNFIKPVDYSVTCNGSSNDMKLSIEGNATDFDAAALQTNMRDLGVELQHDGNKVNVGEAINFTWPTLPALQAVPVKRTGATLSPGEFSAGATLVVNLQ
jgi:type 1 fimbria pilin